MEISGYVSGGVIVWDDNVLIANDIKVSVIVPDSSVTRLPEKKSRRYISSVERIGIKKGKKEGRLESKLEAMKMILSVKFGENGMKLIPVIQSLKDEDRLNVIMKSVIKTDNLSEIEALLN